MKKLKPIYDRVLIKPIQTEKIGAIYIPINSKDPYREGEVIEVGNGRVMLDGTTSPLICKPGNIVLYNHNEGIKVKAELEEYIMLREIEILAIIEEIEDIKIENKE